MVLFISRGIKSRLVKRYFPEAEEIEESNNLLKEELEKKRDILLRLPGRAKKVFSLSKILDDFTSLVEKEKIYEFLADNLKDFFLKGENILFFSLDKNKDSLKLIHSFKRDKLIIKEKEGDIIDWWVLRQNQSLIVGNFPEDFRFDYTQSLAFRERDIHSFIVSPISLGDKVLGLVRIESRKKESFSLDDLRLLRIFCDVGAAVLERAELFEKIKELAIKDALTGLFLRDIFMDKLEEELKRACFSNTKLGFAILDIDDFKKINDTYGHGVGDLVLKKVAGILKKVIGDSGNMVSRFGGEEFVFFVVRTQKEEVKKMAELVRDQIDSAKVNTRRKTVNFSISLGLVICPDDARDSLRLISRADKLLYEAKRKGKNRICFIP
ncbi:MAG: GGDEF domain-containing protein [Candidatus Omnitrophica bacterium]|nr:GGDEF domain-containing protein [Candidatus Omnitrophota bacterium]